MNRVCRGTAGAAVVLMLASGACGGDALDHTIPVERSDSAGVPVYHLSRLPLWDDPAYAWQLDLERSIPTGGASLADEPLLYRPQSFARMDDGRLIVLDASEQRLVVLARDENRVEARFGRTGRGPGEIWSSNSLLWPDGSEAFWVLDPGTQRLSNFSISGGLREERPIQLAGVGGYAVQRPSTREAFFWKVFLDPSGNGLLTDSIGRFDLDESAVHFFAPMAPRVESRSRNTSRAVLFDPLSWFAPVAGGVVTGRSDGGRFRHYDDAGRLLGIIVVPMERAPIPKSAEPEILEEFYGVARGSRMSAPPTIGSHYGLYNIMWPVNDTLFALQQSRRALPAGEPPLPADQFIWRVFSVTGAYAGTIVLPLGTAQPYWIEDDRLIATRRDSLGVATIESHRLSPPRVGPG